MNQNMREPWHATVQNWNGRPNHRTQNPESKSLEDIRRWGVTWEELDRAIKPSAASISAPVCEEKQEHCQSPTKWPPTGCSCACFWLNCQIMSLRIWEYFWLPKESQTDWYPWSLTNLLYCNNKLFYLCMYLCSVICRINYICQRGNLLQKVLVTFTFIGTFLFVVLLLI